jgi:hypothetical protein
VQPGLTVVALYPLPVNAQPSAAQQPILLRSPHRCRRIASFCRRAA